MGVVYKARHGKLGRVVALKMLRGAACASVSRLARFHLESRAVAQLDDPHIVPIYETGEWEGQPWFTMKLVEGQSLANNLDRFQLKPAASPSRNKPADRERPERIARLLATVARAVHYAHQHGVLHRDLKPSNILLDSADRPYLTDFGIAKLAQDESELTLTAELLGTPQYMAPEQATASEVTVAADVYSLGAILFELLAGRAVFEGKTTLDILRKVMEEEPPRLNLAQRGGAPDLETICLKCLEKEPARRYASAKDLAEELERFVRGEPITARPAGRVERVWRWSRRRPALAGALATSVLLFVAGVAGVLSEWRRAEQNAAAESQQRQRAEDALHQLEVDRAEDMLQADKASMGLAYLAWVLRQNPHNRVAAARLFSALTQRSFALPVVDLVPSKAAIERAGGLQSGTFLGTPEGPFPHGGLFSPDGHWVVATFGHQQAWLFDSNTGRLAAPALLHADTVLAAAFSPDSQHVATASKDGQIYIWSTKTGQAVSPPRQHKGLVHHLEFSPDSRHLLSAGPDQGVRLWDLANPQRDPLTLPHEARVIGAHFSPDGQRVATAGADSVARIWDAQTGQILISPLVHGAVVTDVQFSPDGTWLATSSEDGTAQIWETKTGQALTPRLVHAHKVRTARFSPDGLRLVTASTDQTVRVWDALNGQALGQPFNHRHWAVSATFSPDGQKILSGSYDGTAQVLAMHTLRNLTEPLQHQREVVSVSFHPQGQRVITASLSGQIRLWDIQPGQALTRRLLHAGSVRVAEWSSDSRLVVTASTDGTAQVWDARTGHRIGKVLRHRADVWMAEFSPDGGRVATASWDGTARVWNAQTGLPLFGPISHGGYVRCVRFSPDGERLVTGGYDGKARVWDAHTGQPLTEPFSHRDQVWEARFSPDGNRVVTASWDGTARIWDAQSGQPLTKPLQHEGMVVDACFSPDGRHVLTAAYDGSARLWDATDGRLLIPPLRHGTWLSQARFSLDGTRVVTASSDGTGRIWDAQTGAPLAKPLEHRQWVTDAVFSPDGHYVATASWDGTARIWDAQTGQAVSEPFRHQNQVKAVRFSPDGHWILTASWDGTACIWDTGPPGVPVPAWFPALGEAVGGQRFDSARSISAVPLAELIGLRENILASHNDDSYTHWARWFFADRTARPVSPNSVVTMENHVAELVDLNTEASLREAMLVAPTNGMAYARLALLLLKPGSGFSQRSLAEAAWCSRRALQLSPTAPATWEARRQVRRQTNDLAQASQAMKQASILSPAHPQFWHDWGLLLQTNQNIPEALEAFSRATTLAPAQTNLTDLVRLAHSHRAALWNQLGRTEEARADTLAALEIPARDPAAPPYLVDLSPHYNGGLKANWSGDRADNNLAELPSGIQTLGGVEFDVRGLIQLIGQRVPQFPTQVTNIQVRRPCRRLHFLHSAITARGLTRHQIGRYILHYVDGQIRELPIVLGEHLLDWWDKPESGSGSSSLEVAWEGINGKSREHKSQICVFKTTWDNPLPELELRSLDFVSENRLPAPFLVAVTAEP